MTSASPILFLFPQELLLLVTDNLTPLQLSCLSRTCKSLHIRLIPSLNNNFASEAARILLWAAWHNRPSTLERALSLGTSIPEDLFPAGLGGLLHQAVGYRFPEIVRVLLKNGVDPNWGIGIFVPLILATYHARDMDIARMLLEAGAEVDLTRKLDPDRALEMAEAARDQEMMDLLLRFGAERREVQEVGKTSPKRECELQAFRQRTGIVLHD